MELQLHECQQCQALQIENANLKQTIEKLKIELAKFQCKQEEFEPLIAEPLSPIIPVRSLTSQLEKCFVCTAEYMTNDGQKHICNGETEIGCEYCDEVFMSTLDLIDHFNDAHNDTRTRFYCCTQCPEMFSMASLLKFHASSHPPSIEEPIYICNICTEHFPTTEQLNEHQDAMHKRVKSDKKVETKSTKASKQPKWKVSDIKINHAAESLRMKAVKPARPPSPVDSSEPKPFKCGCGRRYKHRRTLLEHIDLKHGREKRRFYDCHRRFDGTKPYKCALCGRSYLHRRTLLEHMNLKHRKGNERSYECYICRLQCKSLHKTQLHVKSHIRTGNCVVCQDLCTETELDTHICSGLNTTNCGYCQQIFTTTKLLLQHLPDCKNEKISYGCGIGKCTKYFLMESLAELHRKSHKDNEPPKMYNCPTCSSSFTCHRDWTLHREQHSRDHLCDECGKGFISIENLSCHKRIHNKKIMKCTQCDFTCLGIGPYKRHLLRHQNIKVRYSMIRSI